MLAFLKHRMSTLHTDGWHIKIVEFATFDIIHRPKKACLYWWIIVPGSLPLAGIVALFFVVLAVVFIVIGSTIFYFVMLVGLLFGYKPRHWTMLGLLLDRGQDSKYAFVHAKDDSFERMKFPLIWAIGPAALIGALYMTRAPTLHAMSWFFSGGGGWVPNHGLYIGYGVAALAVLTLIGAIFKYGLAPLFHRVCPDIKWVDPNEETNAVV